MSLKRVITRISILVTLIALICAACLFYAQPLLSSEAYVVTASLDGKTIQANLLRPPAIPGTFYIRIPEAQPARYSWFGIAFAHDSVFSPIALYTALGGQPYIHTDQAKGVLLTDGKIEDNWDVLFTSDGVHFSNGSLDVTLTRKQ